MYNGFARLYDALMEDVDYEKWADYYFEIFRRYGCNTELGLDLGCGTGSMSVEMSKRGCDMTGVDLSADMLSAACRKAEAAGQDILFLNQDMREFELYGTVSFVISSLDCMNYLTDKNSLKRTFKLVNNYLDPGGLFIFDMNTEYKLGHVLGNNTFAFDNGEIFYTWQNSYDKKSRVCDFYLTFFERESGESYRRFDEVHTQRAYSVNEVKDCLARGGLKVEGVFADKSFSPVREKTERVFFVAREQGK